MQDRITKKFIERNYANLHQKEPPIEQKVKEAKSRIDTGLKKQAPETPGRKRPRTALTMAGFKNRKWSNGAERVNDALFNSRESLQILKY